MNFNLEKPKPNPTKPLYLGFAEEEEVCIYCHLPSAVVGDNYTVIT